MYLGPGGSLFQTVPISIDGSTPCNHSFSRLNHVGIATQITVSLGADLIMNRFKGRISVKLNLLVIPSWGQITDVYGFGSIICGQAPAE